MKQTQLEENNLRSNYQDEIWSYQNCYQVKQTNYQSTYKNQFDFFRDNQDNFFSIDHIIYEPEYFLNTQSEEESKMSNEFPSPSSESCLKDSLISDEGKQQSIPDFYNINNLLIENQQPNSQLHEKDQKVVKNCQCQQGTEDFSYQNIKSQLIQKNNDNKEINQIQYRFQQYENQRESQGKLQSLNQKINQQLKEYQNMQMPLSEKEEKLKQSISTQNSLKNIVFAFVSSVKKMRNTEIVSMKVSQFQNFKKQLIRYMKQHSFNYQMVKYLTTHKVYSLLLLNYLENESYEWLSNSKVIDKQEVKNQIIYLINCIKDIKSLDQMLNN